MRSRLVSLVALLFVIMSLAAGASARTASPSSCGPTWTKEPAPGIGDSGLDTTGLAAVDGFSADDVWAVGGYTHSFIPRFRHRLIAEHWNGRNWAKTSVPTPDHPGGLLGFSGVAEISPTDVWAVGQGNTDNQPVVDRWNGAAWAPVASPSLESGRLNGVAALSADDIWAVGQQQLGSDSATLVEHWDGTAWSVVPSPSVGRDELFAVRALGPDDVWAVGNTSPAGEFVSKTLTEHWDGEAWSVVPSPSPGTQNDNLIAIAGVDGDLWAAGATDGTPLAEHWDGVAWSVVSTPQLPSFDPIEAIAYADPGDVWLLGRREVHGGARVLGLHWDGARVSRVDMPQFSSTVPDEEAFGATILHDGTVWAVGQRSSQIGPRTPLTMRLCPIVVGDGGSTPDNVIVPMGAAVEWHVPAIDAAGHSVTDGSRARLFDSGPLDPGRSFVFTPPGAGKYPVVDSATGATSQIAVSPIAQPSGGDQSTQFAVVWSTEPPPDGFVFQVSLWIPRQGNWVLWLHGEHGDSTLFTPDAGPGQYKFRVRIQRESSGGHTVWSPVATIDVS